MTPARERELRAAAEHDPRLAECLAEIAALDAALVAAERQVALLLAAIVGQARGRVDDAERLRQQARALAVSGADTVERAFARAGIDPATLGDPIVEAVSLRAGGTGATP